MPNTQVITEALKAARKVNDYATAVRILEGLKEKVENKGQYQAYLDELKPVLNDLGTSFAFYLQTLHVTWAAPPRGPDEESIVMCWYTGWRLIAYRCYQQGGALWPLILCSAYIRGLLETRVTGTSTEEPGESGWGTGYNKSKFACHAYTHNYTHFPFLI